MKTGTNIKTEENEVKEKQSCHVDIWMKVNSSDESNQEKTRTEISLKIYGENFFKMVHEKTSSIKEDLLTAIR